MDNRFERVLLAATALGLAVTVFLLGRQNRTLKNENSALLTRLTEPHRGFIVPSFRAQSLSGDSMLIGEMNRDGRQVLFFFTTTCVYCRNSLGAISRIDSALRRDTLLRADLFAVSVDSAPSQLKRFVDSSRLSVPILRLPDTRLSVLYRIRGVPQLLVLDSAGRVTYARSGELAAPEAVDSVLNGIMWRPRSVVAAESSLTRSQ